MTQRLPTGRHLVEVRSVEIPEGRALLRVSVIVLDTDNNTLRVGSPAEWSCFGDNSLATQKEADQILEAFWSVSHDPARYHSPYPYQYSYVEWEVICRGYWPEELYRVMDFLVHVFDHRQTMRGVRFVVDVVEKNSRLDPTKTYTIARWASP